MSTKRSLLWGIVLLVTLAWLAPASHALVIRDVRIVSIVPNPVPCGGAATVTVDVDYRILPWGDPLPQNGDVKLWDDDTFFDEHLGTAGFMIVVGDPQIGTKTVTLTINCAPPNANCKCDLSGNVGTDDEHGVHELYAEVPGKDSSDSVNVTCVKDDGTVAWNDAEGAPGDVLPTACLVGLNEPVEFVDYGLAYDPAQLTLVDAQFDPASAAQFQEAFVDTSMPGVVRFIASNPTPVLVPLIQLQVDFQLPFSAPFGTSLIDTTPDTVFIGELGNPLAVGHGSGQISIVPPDANPPQIQTELVELSLAGQQVIGQPGAIMDDFLTGVPEWVHVRVGYDDGGEIGWAGGALVNPDGSFLIDGVELAPETPPLTIEAIDGAGNTSTALLPPPPLPADCNCDGVVNAADIDPFVLALTNPAGYAAAYPDCDISTADVNGDGVVNAADIDPFVVALTGG